MLDHFKTLEAKSEVFQTIVLAHMKAMPADEWKRLREMALDESRYSCDMDAVKPLATPEEFVASAVSHDGISVEEILIPQFKSNAEEIGAIEGQPVFYVNGAGIYFWGPDRTACATLNVWVTHPAYPPGW